MAKKTVLAIGIEPSLVDFSAFPGLTPELVQNYIQAQIEMLRQQFTVIVEDNKLSGKPIRG